MAHFLAFVCSKNLSLDKDELFSHLQVKIFLQVTPKTKAGEHLHIASATTDASYSEETDQTQVKVEKGEKEEEEVLLSKKKCEFSSMNKSAIVQRGYQRVIKLITLISHFYFSLILTCLLLVIILTSILARHIKQKDQMKNSKVMLTSFKMFDI